MCRTSHLFSVVSLWALSSVAFGQPAPVVPIQTTDTPSSPRSLEERVERLESVINNMAKLVAGQDEIIAQLSAEVRELRGQLSEQARELERVTHRQRESAQQRERLSETMSPSSATPAALAHVDPQPSVAAAYEQQAKDSYESALNLILKEKNYPQAKKALESFVKTHTKSILAANAYYWIGQLELNEQDYLKAEQAFQEVVNNHPDSRKRPDALLKLGMIAAEQGEQQIAVTHFKRLLREAPESAAAKIAQKKLSQLEVTTSAEQNINKQTK